MLFFVKGLDAFASIIIVPELGFVNRFVELGLRIPLCAFNNVHYDRLE